MFYRQPPLGQQTIQVLKAQFSKQESKNDSKKNSINKTTRGECCLGIAFCIGFSSLLNAL
jgi:cell division protein FtsL